MKLTNFQLNVLVFLMMALGATSCLQNATVSKESSKLHPKIVFATDDFKLPSFIKAINPQPGSKILSSQYTSDQLFENFNWRGAEQERKASHICLNLDLSELGFADKSLEFIEQHKLEVNGQMVEPSYDEMLLIQTLVMHEGQVMGSLPSPQMICWQAELGLGVHDIVFQYQRTPSKMHQYAFQFMIVPDD